METIRAHLYTVYIVSVNICICLLVYISEHFRKTSLVLQALQPSKKCGTLTKHLNDARMQHKTCLHMPGILFFGSLLIILVCSYLLCFVI